jgi:DNA-binding NtrC family response regulator
VGSSVSETQQDADGAAESPRRATWLYVVLEADRLLARGARYSLRDVDEIVIGRGDARRGERVGRRVLEVQIPSPWMSSRHTRLVRDRGGWVAIDAGSRNGTFVDGARIAEARFNQGGVVEAGHAFFTIREGQAEEDFDEDGEHAGDPFGLRTLLLPLRERLATLMRVAEESTSPILLLGPTGSGKEVLARAAHERSRREGAFVAVNCGALPAALVEGLLFGHVKGAFSGALREETGFVRAAHRGTLFLDEIGDLPIASQAALLRVLQEGEVVPVGTTRPIAVDLRVIAATHQPIESLIARGAFRSDLLARLRGFTHRLPSLAARREDMGLLFADILERVAGDRAPSFRLAIDAARAIVSHDWPLNVRELQQCIVTSVALARGGVIELRHLPEPLGAAPAEITRDAPKQAPRAEAPRDTKLRAALESHLTEHRGNIAAVARVMEKAPAQIHRWMKRFGLDPNRYRT